MGICCLGFLWLWRARSTEQNSMAEKRKDASSSWKGGWITIAARPCGPAPRDGPPGLGAPVVPAARDPVSRTPSRTRRAAGTWRRGPPRPARAQPGPRAAGPRAPSPRKAEKSRSRARLPGTAKKARGRADGVAWGRVGEGGG